MNGAPAVLQPVRCRLSLLFFLSFMFFGAGVARCVGAIFKQIAALKCVSINEKNSELVSGSEGSVQALRALRTGSTKESIHLQDLRFKKRMWLMKIID